MKLTKFQEQLLILKVMEEVRELCKVGHKERQKLGIPLRQPLQSSTIKLPDNSLLRYFL